MMPSKARTATLDGEDQQEDGRKGEQITEATAAEIVRQSARFGTVRHLIDTFTDEQWRQLSDLIHLLSYIKISPEDTHMLETALVQAQVNRTINDPLLQNSILPYLVDSLRHKESGVHVSGEDAVVTIPDLTTAPRDEFRGVNTHGDAYAYLMKTYGTWLQEGQKCLDRPSMTRLDAKLIKALQQKYTRNKQSMPPLSDVFPTVTEARATREKFGVAGI